MSNDSKLKQATYILHSDGNPSDNILCIDEGGAGGYEYFKLQKDNNNRRFIYEDSNGRAEYEDSIVTEKIRQDLDNEIVRAKQEEARIEGKLDAEITRSTNVDNDHDTRITNINNLYNSLKTLSDQFRIELNSLNSYKIMLDKYKANIKNMIINISQKEIPFTWDTTRKLWVCSSSDFATILDSNNFIYISNSENLKDIGGSVQSENVSQICFIGHEYIVYPINGFTNPAKEDITKLFRGMAINLNKLQDLQNF